MNTARRRPPASLTAMLAVAAFLLVITGYATNATTQQEEPRKKALISQILNERRDVDDLDLAVAQLRAEVDSAQVIAGRKSESQSRAQQQQAELSELAGTTAMQGPATIVRVADAPRDDKANATSFGTDRVQDHDIQLLVNELFASGAEAVAINDNRVSAVTPVRAAGGTIVVNYRPVSSPYRIVAIGADKKTFEQSQVATNFTQWRKQFHLGYAVSTAKKATVPAYTGRVTIDVAQPKQP